MLNAMRKNLKKLSWVLWLVIATFVGTIFAVWGMGGNKGTKSNNVVVMIGDRAIDVQEFYETQRRLRVYYQQIYGDKFPEIEKRLQLEEIALQQLQEREAIALNAKLYSVPVSKTDLKEKVLSYPVFQENGKFSKVRAERVLKQNHITMQKFFDSLKEEITQSRLRLLFQDSLWLSDAELKEIYRLDNEKARVSYLKASARDFKDQIELKPDTLKEYFEEHQKEYQIPEKRAVKYLVLEPGKMAKREPFKKQIEIFQEDIEDYYYEHEDQFSSEKEVRASHILFKTKPGDKQSEEQAKKKAEQVLNELQAGADFGELAKKYSEDGTASQGGDLGFFPRRGKMVEPFAKAAFRLKKGQVSGLVTTPYGYHIIKVTDIKEAHVKNLEESADEIRDILVKEQAEELLQKETQRMVELYDPAAGIEKLAKRFKLEVKETEMFKRNDLIPGLGWIPKLNKAVFNLKEKEIGLPLKHKGSFYLFELKAIEAAHQATYEEVEEQVREMVMEKETSLRAKAKINKLKEKAMETQNWEKLADSKHIQYGESGEFSRKQSIKGIGRDAALISKVFNASEGTILGPQKVQTNYYLIRVDKKIEPDWDLFKKEKNAFRSQKLNAWGSRYYNNWLSKKKDELPVARNDRFFKTMKASNPS